MPTKNTNDRPRVIKLAKTYMSRTPGLSALDAANRALNRFYDLSADDGIWGGSDAAIGMEYRGPSDENNLREQIAADVVEELELSLPAVG